MIKPMAMNIGPTSLPINPVPKIINILATSARTLAEAEEQSPFIYGYKSMVLAMNPEIKKGTIAICKHIAARTTFGVTSIKP